MKKNNGVDNFFGKNQKNEKTKMSLVNEVVKDLKAKNKIEQDDNLIEIKGIGPVIIKALKKEKITSFVQLSKIDINKLQSIVADIRGKHNPKSWIEQSKKMFVEKKEKKIYIGIKKEEKSARKGNVLARNNNKKAVIFKNRSTYERSVSTIVSNRKKQKALLKRVINFILLTLFFGIGLFFTNQTFQGINFEKSIFFYLSISGVVILTSVLFLMKQNIRIRKTPFDVIIFFFVLSYGLSVWFSVDKWHSLVGFFSDPSRGLLFICAMIATFYLILNNFTTQTARKAFNVTVLSMGSISVYTFISGLGLIPTNIQIFIPFSLIGSLKGLSIFLAAGIPILAIAYLLLENYQNKKIGRLFQGIILIFLLTTMIDLIMLKTFVSWSVLAGGIGGLMFLLIDKRGKCIGSSFGRSIIFTILVVFILLAGWAKSDYYALMPTFSKIGLPTEIQIGLPVSYEIVRSSVVLDWKQALLGSGPATFGYDFARFSPKGTVSPVPTIEYVYQGGGVLGEAIPTIGLVGAFLLILIGIVFVTQALKALSVQNETRVYLVGLFVASIILLMNIIINQIGGGLLILSTFILGLTVFFILKARKSDEYYRLSVKGVSISRFAGVLIIIMFLIGLLGGGVYMVRTYLADAYFLRALSIENTEERGQKIIQAIKTRPEEGVYFMKLGQTILTTIKEKNMSTGDTVAQEKKILGEKLIRYVKRGANLMPNDVKTQRFLATVYEVTGGEKPEEMKRVYGSIIELDPNNVQYYIKMGDLYLLESKQRDKDEKLAEALGWYEKALSIQPRAGFIYDRIATIFYQKEDLDQAVINVARAIKVAPNNISYKFTLGVLYQLKGKKEDVVAAEKIFRSLLTNSPQNIDVLTQLGLLYEQTGHIDEAKKQYERVIDIVGENEKLEKIKKVFNKFIENLNNGKLNIKKSDIVTNKSGEETVDKEEGTDEEIGAESESKNIEEKDSEGGQNSGEEVIITVGIEGSINVRNEGSLSGAKLTKIKETGKFQKIGENEKWIQLLILTGDGQTEIKGWVHKKFITE
jgi:tetratricopeptide (TPR) repeat protein/predicted flap endonuclease-1-like 5' DNA nuclease